MGTVRWGILSTANIGVEFVIPGIQRSPSSHVAAIASRDASRARAVADRLGIETAYGSYEELLADPSIDAVYNPLPNHLHVPMTLEAARAGKHVLCEKPIALTAAEAGGLRDLPPGTHVMEAFMVRFHPQWHRVREIARSGRIGRVVAIQCFFSYFNRDAGNIRNIASAGGGALLDIGCYPVVVARFVFAAEPVRVMALIDRDPDFATDRLSSALLDFGEGRHLGFTASTQAVQYQRVHVVGTDGRVEVEIPFNAPQGEAMRILLDDGTRLDASSAIPETVAAVDQYAEEAEAFARAVLGEIELPYGPDDAIRNMKILDALARSETSGHWETP